MLAWVYEVIVAEDAAKVVSKLGFRFSEIVCFEAFRTGPDNVLHVTLSTGRTALIQASHKEFIEHFHQNKPLLLARLEK